MAQTLMFLMATSMVWGMEINLQQQQYMEPPKGDLNYVALRVLSTARQQEKSGSLIITSRDESGLSTDYESFSMPVFLATAFAKTDRVEKALKKCNNVVINMRDPVNWLAFWKPVLPPHYFYIFVGPTKANFQDNAAFRQYLNALLLTDYGGKVELWRRKIPFGSELVKVDFLDAPSHFPEILDFHGLTFRATSFNLPPYSVLDFKKQKFSGTEYQIAAAVARGLNMNMKLSAPSDDQLWGDVTADGNSSGLLGAFKKQQTDIGWANLFVIPERESIMDFSAWHTLDKYCVVVPRPREFPKLWALIAPFDRWTWFGSLISIALVITYYCLYTFLSSTRNNLGNLIILAVSVPLSQGDLVVRSSHIPTGLRFVTLIFMSTMLVLDLAYCGTLKSFLTVKVSPTQLDTLEQLDAATFKNNYHLLACCSIVINYFNQSLIPSNNDLANKFVMYDNHFKAMKAMGQDGHVTIHTRNVLTFNIRKNFIDKDGEPTVHLMKECFMSVPIALGLQNKSPFKTAVDQKILQLREAGLLAKWFSDGANSVGHPAIAGKGPEMEESNSLSLGELQGIMFVLMAGLVLSLIVFIIEKLVQSLLLFTDFKFAYGE